MRNPAKPFCCLLLLVLLIPLWPSGYGPHGASTELGAAAPQSSPALDITKPAAHKTSVTGSIRGTVQLVSKIQPRSLAFDLYVRRSPGQSNGEVQRPENELSNVVLYLEGVGKKLVSDHDSLRQESATIRQVNETFVPHVLSIRAGTTVHFPNGDPFFHNVFSLSSTRSFDLGRYPKDQVRSVTFQRPGIVKVFCHIHSHMNAVIFVFDHPYFCTASENGEFLIERIPAGNYTLVAWHERLAPQRQKLTLKGEESLVVDVEL